MSNSIPPSSSISREGNRLTLDLTLPTSWDEVGEPLFVYVLRLVAAGLSFDDIRAYIVLHTVPRPVLHRLTAEQLGVAADVMRFLDTPPTHPMRPSHLGRGKAIAAELQGVKFHDYLVIENLWQGFIDESEAVKDAHGGDIAFESQALRALLPLLYTGYHVKKFEPWHAIAVVYWIQGLKSLFALTFPNLFRSTGNPDAAPEVNMREVMETQIRALTGGDLTKRAAVLESETWAALTELDAKAREAEEINAMRKK